MNAISHRRSFELDVSARGYQVLFRANETNRCPGCGHAQWLVGRITAECGICSTALPLADAHWSDSSAPQKAVALHVVDGARAGRNKRRDERIPADGRVLALFIDGEPNAFALSNISKGGVAGEAPPGIAEAQSIEVELEDGTMLKAELRWTEGSAVGLAFLHPADSISIRGRRRIS